MKRINSLIKNYAYPHAKHRQGAIVYYRKLLKASLLISIVPIVVVVILVIYDRLNFFEGLIGAVAVFFGSIFFAKPYLDDLSSLTEYVENLAFNRIAPAPPLSLLGNVDELSGSVKKLNESWSRRNIDLESALAESGILFDTIPDILLMLDKKSNIIRANNAAFAAFHKQLNGININELSQSDEIHNAIKSTLKSGRGSAIEITLQTGGINQDYLVMIEKFPVKSATEIALVIIMHNITEEKRRKEMLKDFVANASHEIRTPLTSVSGFIENMQSMEDDNKIRKEFLGIIAEQTARITTLVNDLLSLSKVEMNENTRPTDFVNISDILRIVKRRLKWQAGERHIKISFKEIKELPEVIGDESELTQVFTNIISNAIKYSPDNTTITITGDVTDKFHKSKNFPADCNQIATISIKDEGEGIAEEHLPRIMERFYRVDKARSHKVGGTGLGLAIAKHIIKRHMGDILIESKIGEGSVFTVRLPVNKKV